MHEPQKQLPYRFKETTFREYEKVILVVLSSWPKASKFWPAHYEKSMATFSCRLRDAMRSFVDNRWESTIPYEQFKLLHEAGIKVSERTDGSILVGTQKAIDNYVNSTDNGVPRNQPLPEADPNFRLDMSLPSDQLLATMSQSRKVAPRIVLVNISEEKVEELQRNFDIAIDKNEDGTFTLI